MKRACVLAAVIGYAAADATVPDLSAVCSCRRQRKKFKFTELQAELQKLTKEERETRRQRSALNAARNELQVPAAAPAPFRSQLIGARTASLHLSLVSTGVLSAV